MLYYNHNNEYLCELLHCDEMSAEEAPSKSNLSCLLLSRSSLLLHSAREELLLLKNQYETHYYTSSRTNSIDHAISKNLRGEMNVKQSLNFN